MVTPLDGSKLKPLKQPSIDALRSIAAKPAPRQEFNPGVCNLLQKWQYVCSIQRPSPYAIHKGREIEFFEVTQAGRDFLATLKARSPGSRG